VIKAEGELRGGGTGAPPSNGMDRRRPSVHNDSTLSTVAYSEILAYCATLGGTTDRNQLLMISQSSIILLSDRGQPSV